MAVNHLTKSFSIGKRNVHKAVDDVSFRIYKGEVFGLVGESGSGKSTVANCVMNLCKPEAERFYIRKLIPAAVRSSGKIKKCFSVSGRLFFRTPLPV